MTQKPNHSTRSRGRLTVANGAITIAAALIVNACNSDTGDGTAPFLPGKYCFASSNERFVIENGVMSTMRRNLTNIPTRVKIGAKTGQQYIYPQEQVALNFDEDGEYLERGPTTIGFWQFSKKDRGDVTIFSLQSDDPRSVIFKSVECKAAASL